MLTILVIEDERHDYMDIERMAQTACRHYGLLPNGETDMHYAIERAVDLAEAKSRIRHHLEQQSPLIVIFDLYLPNANTQGLGDEFVLKWLHLQEDPRERDSYLGRTPFIVYSGLRKLFDPLEKYLSAKRMGHIIVRKDDRGALEKLQDEIEERIRSMRSQHHE